ncbi:fungal-specific transcription factor domain-containing protein [Lipomyces arxii]|uniref:fungal-specific transcription factor domain-containing protein n=1 Tax=Lipomyces arxii TaxID=56418 RepID=UPI0034CD2651
MSSITLSYGELPQQPLHISSGPFGGSPSISPEENHSPAKYDNHTDNSEGKKSESTNLRKKRRQVGLKRSRTGCLQCRQRRKKCRLEKPTCKSCQDRNWTCVYPSQTGSRESAPHLQDSSRQDSVSTAGPVVEFTSPPLQNISSTEQIIPFNTGTSEGGTPESSIFDDTFLQDENTPTSAPFATSSMALMPQIGNFSPPIEHLDELDPLLLLNYTPTQRELVHYFTDNVALVISYFKHEPPFRKLILGLLMPTSRQELISPASTGLLLSSVCALSSAHKSYALGLTPDDTQLTYHTAALEDLITLLEDLPTRLEDENTQNVLLASILILVYYEIAKGGNIQSISMHLNGAYRITTSFLNHVIYRLRSCNSIVGTVGYQISNETYFLFKTFQYFDVICSLSKRGKLLDHSLQLYNFLSTYSRLRPGASTKVAHGDQFETGLDPVVGLAEDLWPMIVRMCILCNDCDFGQSLTPTILGRASLLELEMSSWEVPNANNASVTPSPQELAMQSAAKVYQLAAQVYLLRTFFPLENVADMIQAHVRSALDHLARVCTLDGSMVALLWPVSVIASECVDSIDRGFVKVVFQKLGKRQGMGNVMRGLQSVEAGWRGVPGSESVMFG